MADLEKKLAVMRGSGSVKPGAEFLLDFALFEARLRDDGEQQEGIDEIKQCIRNDWGDPEKQAWWKAYVKQQADVEREIQSMAKGITERIKTQQSAAKREQEALKEAA